jgi:BirA family biotin operon repressor/biotin-[acetyl-CoA-carboxylase] ligase
LEEYAFIDQVGKILLFYTPSCESTQDLVPACAAQAGGKHPTALLTFHQTRGRGQQDRTWEAEPGKNLAISVWLPLKNPRPDTFPLLNMALTTAITKTIINIGISAEIKWPNDLRCRSAKLSGILMETHSDKSAGKFLCIGIGVNVNQTGFEQMSQPATSLKILTGKDYNLMDLANAMLVSLQTAFKAWEKQPDNISFLNDFNDLLEGRNQECLAETADGQAFRCRLTGVDVQGRIVLETDNEIKAMHHGTVRLKTCFSNE